MDNLFLVGRAIAGSDTPLLMTIRNKLTGSYIGQSDIGSISVKAANWDTNAPVTLNTQLDIGTHVHDSLQLTGWTQDNDGWNFAHVVPGSAIPSGGEYRVRYIITYTDGFVEKVVWKLFVEPDPLD